MHVEVYGISRVKQYKITTSDFSLGMLSLHSQYGGVVPRVTSQDEDETILIAEYLPSNLPKRFDSVQFNVEDDEGNDVTLVGNVNEIRFDFSSEKTLIYTDIVYKEIEDPEATKEMAEKEHSKLKERFDRL